MSNRKEHSSIISSAQAMPLGTEIEVRGSIVDVKFEVNLPDIRALLFANNKTVGLVVFARSHPIEPTTVRNWNTAC